MIEIAHQLHLIDVDLTIISITVSTIAVFIFFKD